MAGFPCASFQSLRAPVQEQVGGPRLIRTKRAVEGFRWTRSHPGKERHVTPVEPQLGFRKDHRPLGLLVSKRAKEWGGGGGFAGLQAGKAEDLVPKILGDMDSTSEATVSCALS